MKNDEILKKLFSLQDTKYRDFQAKLIPGLEPLSVIGVRTPDLRKFAKELYKEGEYSLFLKELPHKYFDENQLHAFIISEIKDFNDCIFQLENFLPFINNWATCDQLSPKIFKKNKIALLIKVREWLKSTHTYTVRFAIGMLMQHFLDEDFSPEYLELVASVKSEEYYINMMIAWYFATALAKQYEDALPFIEQNRLEKWTCNKSIQKALESFRVSEEHKKILRGLKR